MRQGSPFAHPLPALCRAGCWDQIKPVAGDIGNWLLSRRRASQRRIGRILLRERSWRRSHGLSTGAVRKDMPTDAYARAEEHSDNSTQAAGSVTRITTQPGLPERYPQQLGRLHLQDRRELGNDL